MKSTGSNDVARKGCRAGSTAEDWLALPSGMCNSAMREAAISDCYRASFDRKNTCRAAADICSPSHSQSLQECTIVGIFECDA